MANISLGNVIFKESSQSIFFGAESWTCSEKDYARLNEFHTKRLRAIVGKRRDEISNKDLFNLTRMCELEMYVRKAKLR